MDISGPLEDGRQVVSAYGDGGFRINGVRHEGSVIVMQDRTYPWSARTLDNLQEQDVDLICRSDPPVEILLVGCGQEIAFISLEMREKLRGAGVSVDVMDTGAAARTFNVLQLENRRVAAALIAVQ